MTCEFGRFPVKVTESSMEIESPQGQVTLWQRMAGGTEEGRKERKYQRKKEGGGRKTSFNFRRNKSLNPFPSAFCCLLLTYINSTHCDISMHAHSSLIKSIHPSSTLTSPLDTLPRP
jgi:hypothetical protein